MATPLTGDIKDRVEVAKRGVTLHNFPQVLAADLTDVANIVNVSSQSGKRLGAQILAVDSYTAPTTAAVYVASGSAPDAVWVLQTQVLGTGSADVTPA